MKIVYYDLETTAGLVGVANIISNATRPSRLPLGRSRLLCRLLVAVAGPY